MSISNGGHGRFEQHACSANQNEIERYRKAKTNKYSLLQLIVAQAGVSTGSLRARFFHPSVQIEDRQVFVGGRGSALKLQQNKALGHRQCLID